HSPCADESVWKYSEPTGAAMRASGLPAPDRCDGPVLLLRIATAGLLVDSAIAAVAPSNRLFAIIGMYGDCIRSPCTRVVAPRDRWSDPIPGGGTLSPPPISNAAPSETLSIVLLDTAT